MEYAVTVTGARTRVPDGTDLDRLMAELERKGVTDVQIEPVFNLDRIGTHSR